MNAPVSIPLESAAVATATPADLTITVRDRRFEREAKRSRWWLNGDPVATAWYTSLSAVFPRGEAFFIEAVKAHREGVPPHLAEEIRAFVVQELNHTREHIAFNKMATAAGYDLEEIDRRLAEFLDMTKGRPPIINLASTMALEHFTAMLAYQFLVDPVHFEGAEGDAADLWRWHAVEEIEHKAVAYDTWLHATRDWSRWKRWKLKSLMMLIITKNFIGHRIDDMTRMLAQDGITGWTAKRRILSFLFVSPGVLRRIIPAWVSYFMPGFHPWNHDDRALISGK